MNSPSSLQHAQPQKTDGFAAPSLWKVSRPRFWMYVFGPYIVGLVAGAPSVESLWDWRALAFAVFWTLPANLFIYGVNDVHDFETDSRNRKKESYEARLERQQQRALLRTVWLLVLPFCALALLFAGARATACLAGFFAFAYAYSAPPVRAKARPLLDSAFNILYVFPAWFGHALAGGSGFWLTGVLAAWCWVAAMHAYSAVPDISADQDAHVDTIATHLGGTRTLLVCLGLYTASAALSFPALGALSLFLGLIYGALMLLSIRAGSEEAVLQIYKYFPLINTFAGFCLFWRVALLQFPELLGTPLDALLKR